MKGSPFAALEPIPVVVLAAGHGGKDTGACGGGKTEREEAITITNRIGALLLKVLPSHAVVIAPHGQDTHETIPWLNKQYAFGSAWALEIHRDSADTIKEPDASLRCGVYHGSSQVSALIADYMKGAMMTMGAAKSTWSRSHTECRFGSLGWISQVRCLSHLVELGFMEGRHDAAHIEHLAEIGAAAILSAFAGRILPL